ncbi:hypothetical protein RKD19_005212 [Streptomyces canus]
MMLTLPPSEESGTVWPSLVVASQPAPVTMSPYPSPLMSPMPVTMPGLRVLTPATLRPLAVPGTQ